MTYAITENKKGKMLGFKFQTDLECAKNIVQVYGINIFLWSKILTIYKLKSLK